MSVIVNGTVQWIHERARLASKLCQRLRWRRKFKEPEPWTDKELLYLERILKAQEWRELEILRLAETLRALERVASGPYRKPQEVWRALNRIRGILGATGKPWPGRCRRCGTVALARARRCPVCDLTEKDGVTRSPSRHFRGWP